jgi:ribulose-bisphosphate carboxylase large chain
LLGRSREFGVSFVAWQKLWRLAGVDHLHCNGIANKFWEPDESVIASARECLRPMFGTPGQGCEIMPVFSSAQTARQAPATYAALGTTDLIFAAGGGIMAHPGGIAAGVRSLHQAWQAAVEGIPLEAYATTHAELRAALDRFKP